jgi:hypothetical protein
MKNKKFVAGTLTAAMVASVVAPVVAQAAPAALKVEKVVVVDAGKIKVKFTNAKKFYTVKLSKVLWDGNKSVTFTIWGKTYTQKISKFVDANYTAALKAVAAYKAAPLTTLAEVEAAKKLEVAANAALAKVKNTSSARVNGQKGLVVAQAAIVAAKEAELSVPAVVSVTAVNLKQLEVKFNVAVDKTTAETIANYYVSTTSSFGTNAVAANWKAELKADQKTVVLTNSDLAAALTAEATYFFKAENLKGVNAKEVAVETKQFTTGKLAADVVAPEVVKTAVVGSNLEITLSEVLTALPTVVRVDGANVTPTFKLNDNTVLVVPIGAYTADVLHSLYVAGGKDDAGNDLKAFNGSFVKSSDTVKPAVKQVKQLTDTSIAVYFTEDLGLNELATNDVNFVQADGTVVTGSVVAAVATDANGDKYYEVTIPAYAANTDSQTLQVLIAAGMVNDGATNTNAAFSATYTFTKDKAAPAFVSQKLVKNVSGEATGVELTFSEDVTIDTTKVRVLKNNVELVAGGLTSVHGVAAKKHVIDFGVGATLPAGTYTVVFNDGAVIDNSPALNKSVAFSLNVAVDASSVVPTINAATSSADSVAVANTILVNYNQAMDLASLTNLANYKLDGVALDSTKANPVYVTYNGLNPIAHIELKEGWNNFGKLTDVAANAILTVSGAKDVNGTVISDTQFGVLLQDNKAARLTSAVKTSNSVVLTFDEALDGTGLDATDFLVKDLSGNAVGTVGTVSLVAGNNKQVQINFTTVPTVAYTVETNVALTLDLTDLNGVEVVEGVKVTAN